MPFIPRTKPLTWTAHAKAKMQFYKLSPARVRHVLHSPRRVEEGVAPKTVAAMQPASVKSGTIGGAKKETWSHEIWVMFQDTPRERKVISAWRYPGVSKTRSPILRAMARQEYDEYAGGQE